MIKNIFIILAGLFPAFAYAGHVEIVKVELIKHSATWQANVTLKHGDTGWKHYADAWRLVDADGNEIGKRTLWHPHVNEQPFTRSLSDFYIPESSKTIFVEAHDKKHGWSPNKVRINMNEKTGERYQIRAE